MSVWLTKIDWVGGREYLKSGKRELLIHWTDHTTTHVGMNPMKELTFWGSPKEYSERAFDLAEWYCDWLFGGEWLAPSSIIGVYVKGDIYEKP